MEILISVEEIKHPPGSQQYCHGGCGLSGERRSQVSKLKPLKPSMWEGRRGGRTDRSIKGDWMRSGQTPICAAATYTAVGEG